MTVNFLDCTKFEKISQDFLIKGIRPLSKLSTDILVGNAGESIHDLIFKFRKNLWLKQIDLSEHKNSKTT